MCVIKDNESGIKYPIKTAFDLLNKHYKEELKPYKISWSIFNRSGRDSADFVKITELLTSQPIQENIELFLNDFKVDPVHKDHLQAIKICFNYFLMFKRLYYIIIGQSKMKIARVICCGYWLSLVVTQF